MTYAEMVKSKAMQSAQQSAKQPSLMPTKNINLLRPNISTRPATMPMVRPGQKFQTMPYNNKGMEVPINQEPGQASFFKDPKNIALMAGAGLLLFMVLKKG